METSLIKKKEIQLNEQQKLIVESELEDCKIIGNPGVGKTTIMIHKILHLERTGRIKNGNNFLIVTFTNNARIEFIEKSKNLRNSKKNLCSMSNVLTIHKLAGKICKKFGNLKNCDVSTIVNAATHMIETIDTADLSLFFKDLLMIIVDEAQDISHVQYNFIIQLKRKLGIYLILIGDPNQNIFQFQGGSDRFLLDFPGKQYNLTINNRSAKEIIEFANHFRPNQNFPPMVSSRDEKGSVEIYRLSDEKIMEKVIEIIKELKINREDVAVIGPVKKSKKCFNSYMNIGLSLFENLFNVHDIGYITHYSSNESYKKVKRQKGKINIHTIHSSKGDEFHTVFLLNFHFFTQGRRPTYEAFNQFMYLWWTGITRVKMRLIILMDETKEHWPMLQLVPKGLYQFYGTKIEEKNFEVDIPIESKKITITNLLDELQNESFFELEQLLDYKIAERIFLKNHVVSRFENHSLIQSTLRILFFFMRSPDKRNYIKRLKERFSNKILIPIRFKNSCIRLFKKIGYSVKDTVSLDSIYHFKDQWEDNTDKELFHFLTSRMNLSASYSIGFEDNLVFENDQMMSNNLDFLIGCEDKKQIFKIIFFYCLYIYQLENEKKYLWNRRLELFKAIYNDDFFNHIQNINITGEENLLMTTHHEQLMLKGQIDVFANKNEVHSIIYQSSINKKMVFELILNSFQVGHEMKKIFIWNLFDGKCTEILYQKPDELDLLLFLCKYSGQKCRNIKILFSIKRSDDDEIIDSFFYELSIRAEIKEDKIPLICDRATFIGFDSKAIENLRTEHHSTLNLWKTIVSIDPLIRNKTIKKCAEKICNKKYTIRSCYDEVFGMLDIITRMRLIENHLI